MKKLLLLTAIFALAATACDKEEGNTGEPYRVYTDEATMQGDLVIFHGHMSKFLSRDVSGSGNIYFLGTATSGDYEEGHTIKVPCSNRVDENFTGANGSLKKGKLIYYKACVDRGSKTYSGEEKSKQLPVEQIKINQPFICIDEGANAQASFSWIPSDVEKPAVKWEVSPKDVASVDENGLVRGLKKGSATLYVTTVEGGEIASCAITVRTHYTGNVPVVDLGLSVVWAENNLAKTPGATEFYAWGELAPRTTFFENDYNPVNPEFHERLLANEDAATEIMKAPFRMPTKAELQELFFYTTPRAMIHNEVKGVLLVSELRQESDGTYPSIFIPYTGYWLADHQYWGDEGFYLWSSDAYESDSKLASCYCFRRDSNGNNYSYYGGVAKYIGACIRAVVD